MIRSRYVSAANEGYKAYINLSSLEQCQQVRVQLIAASARHLLLNAVLRRRCRCGTRRPPLSIDMSCMPDPQHTVVNPAGDAGDTSPNILVGGTSTGISRQYYYVLLDIADQYWLPSVRSASSRFHSAVRRHQFASVRQADSRLTRLVPPTLNSR